MRSSGGSQLAECFVPFQLAPERARERLEPAAELAGQLPPLRARQELASVPLQQLAPQTLPEQQAQVLRRLWLSTLRASYRPWAQSLRYWWQ